MLYTIFFERLEFENVVSQELSVNRSSAASFYCNLSEREVAFLCNSEQTLPLCGLVNLENYKIQYYSSKLEYETALKRSTDENHTILYYDVNTERLTIFRDNFGVVPVFYYFIPQELLLISDSVRDVVCCLRQNRKEVTANEDKLRAYLETGIVNVPYTNDTFFSGVQSVLPGYKVSFTSREKSQERVIAFNTTQWKETCSSLDDFGDGFKRLFGGAVCQSIEGKKKIGATLSGGLDSSSIVSMIRFCYPDIPIVSVFVSDPRTKKMKLGNDHDNFYSSEVARLIGSDHKIIWRRAESLENIEEVLKLIYQPPLMMGGFTTFIDMFNSMKESEIDVLVTGIDGDSIVGFGRRYLTTLFREERWEQISEIVSNHPSSLKNPKFRKFFLREFIYDEIRSLFHLKRFSRALFLLFRSCRNLNVNWINVAKLIFKRSAGKLLPSFNRGKNILIRRASAQRGKKDDLISTLSDVSEGQQPYFARILSNHNVRLVEEYYAVSRFFEIDVRFPFFSKELYELCLAVPDKLNYFGGIGRGAMRHGLKGILLDSVRLRTNKSIGNNETLKENTLSLISLGEKYLKVDNDVWNFVNRSNFFYNLEQVKKGWISDRYLAVLLFQINRVLYVAIWFAIVNADIRSEEGRRDK